jgi:hypothetical protein
MHTGKQCTVNVTTSSMRYVPMMSHPPPERDLTATRNIIRVAKTWL